MDFKKRIMRARAKDEKAEKASQPIDWENLLPDKLNRIKVLTPIISKRIDTANTLIDNGYGSFLERDKWGYGGFISDCKCHNLGFMLNRDTGKVDSVGFCNGGSWGEFDFHTTGEKTYMTEWCESLPCDEPIRLGDAERMLRAFSHFEGEFFGALHSFLSKKGT